MNQDDVLLNITEKEQSDVFLNFCTLVCLLRNKRMCFANVFLTMLENKYLLNFFKNLICEESNLEAIRYFIQQAPSVAKSKHVTKVLNHTPIHLLRPSVKNDNTVSKTHIQHVSKRKSKRKTVQSKTKLRKPIRRSKKQSK